MTISRCPAAIILALLLGTTSLTAGIHVGSGGDAVVCYEDTDQSTLKSAELLDHYEATTILRGLAPDFGTGTGQGDSYQYMIDHVLNRVRQHNPGLAWRLGSYIEDFIANAEFVDDGVLSDINDSHHVVIPYNCVVRQIALQRTPRFPEEPRYYIDESLFHRTELPSRAMLAIHESLYRIALEHGQVNSLNVRYLNAYLSSSKPDRDSTQEFNSILTKAGFGVEFWYDRRGESYWALFEKGIELPSACFLLAGDFYAPSIRELKAWLPNVLLSPLQRFLFANGSESVTIWSGDWDIHRSECSGNGTNAYKTVTISDNDFSVGYQCMNVSGPNLLCLER